MTECEFRPLAQEDAHAIAFADALRGKHVGQPRTGGEQLAKGPGAHAAVGALDDQRQSFGWVTLADRATDVEALGLWPAEAAHCLVV